MLEYEVDAPYILIDNGDKTIEITIKEFGEYLDSYGYLYYEDGDITTYYDVYEFLASFDRDIITSHLTDYLKTLKN